MPPFSLPRWLRLPPPYKMTARVYVPAITFVGEQDGPVERTVKALWLPILSAHPEIRRAFLVRAAYANPKDTHVVLALCSKAGGDEKLVEALRGPYASIFSRDCPLDIAFVTATQESQIERVCSPFHESV